MVVSPSNWKPKVDQIVFVNWPIREVEYAMHTLSSALSRTRVYIHKLVCYAII